MALIDLSRVFARRQACQAEASVSPEQIPDNWWPCRLRRPRQHDNGKGRIENDVAEGHSGHVLLEFELFGLVSVMCDCTRLVSISSRDMMVTGVMPLGTPFIDTVAP